MHWVAHHASCCQPQQCMRVPRAAAGGAGGALTLLDRAHISRFSFRAPYAPTPWVLALHDVTARSLCCISPCARPAALPFPACRWSLPKTPPAEFPRPSSPPAAGRSGPLRPRPACLRTPRMERRPILYGLPPNVYWCRLEQGQLNCMQSRNVWTIYPFIFRWTYGLVYSGQPIVHTTQHHHRLCDPTVLVGSHLWGRRCRASGETHRLRARLTTTLDDNHRRRETITGCEFAQAIFLAYAKNTLTYGHIDVGAAGDAHCARACERY